MTTLSTLTKKTKQEVLDEYEKLKEQFDELQIISKSIYKSENKEVFLKAKEQINNVPQSISNLKKSISEAFNLTSNQLDNNLNVFLSSILEQANKFNELEQAIELSKNNIKVIHGIEITAETLKNLITEYEKRKKEFEESLKEQKESIETEISAKKRNWSREEEEYQYSLDLKKKREHIFFEEEKFKKEQILTAREKEVKNCEIELDKLRKNVENFPTLLNNELQTREKETLKRSDENWEQKIILLKKDWEAEKRFYEMQNKNLEDQIKKQEIEINILKKETEAANKKTQELAVKIVENNSKNRLENIVSEKT